jgi:hypothetical protein
MYKRVIIWLPYNGLYNKTNQHKAMGRNRTHLPVTSRDVGKPRDIGNPETNKTE